VGHRARSWTVLEEGEEFVIPTGTRTLARSAPNHYIDYAMSAVGGEKYGRDRLNARKLVLCLTKGRSEGSQH
jgi:hypothetical protein